MRITEAMGDPVPKAKGKVPVLGYRLSWESFGSPDRGTVLCLHGGPGVPHGYLRCLADLADTGPADDRTTRTRGGLRRSGVRPSRDDLLPPAHLPPPDVAPRADAGDGGTQPARLPDDVGAQRVRGPRFPSVLGHHGSAAGDQRAHAHHRREVRRDHAAHRPQYPSRDSRLGDRDFRQELAPPDVGGTGAVHARRGPFPPTSRRPLTSTRLPACRGGGPHARPRDAPRTIPAAISWAIRSGSGWT